MTALADNPIHAGVSAERSDELAQIIRAYHQVTENLQRSHDALGREVERLQAQLASADAQLQRSKRLAALGEMAAGIAHEIRNPLAAIQLYAAMLVEDLTALAADRSGVLAASAETAGKIAQAVRGLNAIVNDVLSFARELRPRIQPVPVSSIIARALAAHRPALAAAGIRVVVPPEDPSWLLPCDGELMHQAMLNLIRNACDAMAERGGGTLSFQVRREAAMLVIAVRDTGPGIAQEHIDRIFNPFFTTRSTGTGLGLAIVHRIVDAHGGAISVHNDGGAVFELRLPVRSDLSAAGGAGTPGGGRRAIPAGVDA